MTETMLALIKRLKTQQPLALNITNFVTMDFIANGLLALGASPIMSQSTEEIEALVAMSGSVVINLGTLNDSFLDLAQTACHFANQYHKPLMLDPVGAGATRYRTESAQALLADYAFQMIRGNASEIAALAGLACSTKGVDSTLQTHEAMDAAQTLATTLNTTICVSGATDLIVTATDNTQHQHGSPLMTQITGMGCLLTAVIGAFHVIEANSFVATHAASLYYALAGEHAALDSTGPGHFKSLFLDALHHLTAA